MKLHYNVASPAIAQVMAVAIETGLGPAGAHHRDDDPDSSRTRTRAGTTPLGKIPYLVTDDGAVLLRFPGDLQVSGRPASRAEDVQPGARAGLRAAGRGRRHARCRAADPLRDLLRPGPALAGVARGPEGEVPPRPRRSGPEAGSFGDTVDISTMPSAARWAISISATPTRTGARPGGLLLLVRAIRNCSMAGPPRKSEGDGSAVGDQAVEMLPDARGLRRRVGQRDRPVEGGARLGGAAELEAAGRPSRRRSGSSRRAAPPAARSWRAPPPARALWPPRPRD